MRLLLGASRIKRRMNEELQVRTDPTLEPGEWVVDMDKKEIRSNPPIVGDIPWYYHPKYWEKGDAARNEEDMPKLAEIVAEAERRKDDTTKLILEIVEHALRIDPQIGTTWGDTHYDNPSVVYGINIMRDCVLTYLKQVI